MAIAPIEEPIQRMLVRIARAWRTGRSDDHSRHESAAYAALVRRVFRNDAPGILGQEPAVRYVPRPFQEAFEHPQRRFDADARSFVVEIFGPAGLALAFASVFVATVVVALSTGLYAPGGEPPTKSPVPPGEQKTIPPVQQRAPTAR